MDEIIKALESAGYTFYAVSISNMHIESQGVDVNVIGQKEDDSPGIVIGLSGNSLAEIKNEIVDAIKVGTSIIQ